MQMLELTASSCKPRQSTTWEGSEYSNLCNTWTMRRKKKRYSASTAGPALPRQLGHTKVDRVDRINQNGARGRMVRTRLDRIVCQYLRVRSSARRGSPPSSRPIQVSSVK